MNKLLATLVAATVSMGAFAQTTAPAAPAKAEVKPAVAAPAAAPAPAARQAPAPRPASGFDDMDDDIPF